MNVFESLICSQYAGLKLTGNGESAKTKSMFMVTVAWMMHLSTILFILVITDSPIIKINTHGLNGKLFGKLLVFALIAAIYPIVYYCYGKKQRFDSLTQQFDALAEQEQKRIIKKGLYYLLASLGVFLIVVAILIFRK